MLKNKKRNKRIFALILALLLCFTLTFTIASDVHAFGLFDSDEGEDSLNVGWLSALSGGVAGIGKGILGFGMNLVRKVTAVFLTAAMATLDLMLSDQMYEQVFFSATSRDAINTGWGLVRDFVNMFYILILIFLAIATILRVNKFSDKKLMLSVVFSALLVNFSQAITFVFIDISNLAMNYFAGQLGSDGVSFSSALADMMNISDLANGNAYFNQDGAIIAAFAEVIFTAILAVTIFVLAIALIIRMIAFWVLIVLSPLAFFGLALPGTGLANMWRSWFSKLTSYAFFGPILLFFLWLSFILVRALTVSKDASSIPMINDSPVAAGNGSDGFVINFFKNTIPFVAAIYMLLYGFSLAKDMANKAGSAVGSVFGKGQSWMGKAGRYAAIAGTGAAGLAAYGGYQYGKGLAGDFVKAEKKHLEGMNSTRWLTKKGREDISKERVARATGDTEDLERGKANESYNTMKKDGLTKDEVLKNLESKDKYSAAGAAKLAAEQGWLKKEEDYVKAQKASRSVEGMGSQFENLAKKKNLSSAIKVGMDEEAKKKGYVDAFDYYNKDQDGAYKFITDKYTGGKGAADFAEQGGEFFEDSSITSKYLRDKYAKVTNQTVKKNERKKALDKINDPDLQSKVLNIIG